MGSCGSRDRVPYVDGAHAEENYSFGVECQIKLHGVEFRDFQAAIKRFGYRMDLNEEHLKSVAPEIRLNYDEMLANRNKGQALCYLDQNFAYKGGKHNVENLILVGWLLCRHWSDETQATELWHIMNPKLEEQIGKQKVVATIKQLMYVAIDLNLTMIKTMKDSPEKENALKYHQRIAANRDTFIEQVSSQLEPMVSKEQLEFLDQVYRSYDMRMTIAGDKELEEGNNSIDEGRAKQ